jgi:protein-S-isoprenylcysteine O-methyltransferase Ste14
MRRAAGIAVGVLTHVLFAYTVWRLFWFLKGEVGAPGRGQADNVGRSLGLDGLLAAQFAIVHSALLLPATRRRLGRWIAAPFYGCFFCVATCTCLLLAIQCWRPAAQQACWALQGWAGWVMEGGFYASWAALFYSLSLTGLGYQTGWTPWWHWLRRRPLPARDFRPRGVYHVLRHPIYLSFLGLIWFTPTMTADRTVLTAVWTVYIFVGSYLKDERLAYYLGPKYRRYQQRVAGYPFMLFGPLAKRAPAEG